jgi:enamine deaminase RidA (YjgF/YER057c/UK114 family)
MLGKALGVLTPRVRRNILDSAEDLQESSRATQDGLPGAELRRIDPDGETLPMFFSQDHPGDLIFLSWTPSSLKSDSGATAAETAYREMARFLKDRGAVLLSERIYGEGRVTDQALETRDRLMAGLGSAAAVPPTLVEGAPCVGAGLAGVHAIAVASAGTGADRLIEQDGLLLGRQVDGRDARFLGLSDLGRLARRASAASPAEEVQLTFEATDRLLQGHAWSFKDVQRTWFYLDDILAWYGEFNRVRNAAFERTGLFCDGVGRSAIPASTGIRGRNVRGGQFALDLLAARPVPGRPFSVRRLSHGKQNEATEYGSAFARGLELALDSSRIVFVSGTASIDDHGRSVHIGDFAAQTEHTLDTVETLLAAAEARVSDVCQATAFLKHASDYDAFAAIAGRHGLPADRVVCTVADVCRDELLFELDATAVLSA